MKFVTSSSRWLGGKDKQNWNSKTRTKTGEQDWEPFLCASQACKTRAAAAGCGREGLVWDSFNLRSSYSMLLLHHIHCVIWAANLSEAYSLSKRKRGRSGGSLKHGLIEPMSGHWAQVLIFCGIAVKPIKQNILCFEGQNVCDMNFSKWIGRSILVLDINVCGSEDGKNKGTCNG